MQGLVPCAIQTEQLNIRKIMDKKFYEIPEIEEINLHLEGAILTESDPDKPEILDGDGDTGDLG